MCGVSLSASYNLTKKNHITIISKCAPINYVEFTNAHKMRASIDQTCCHAYVNNI